MMHRLMPLVVALGMICQQLHAHDKITEESLSLDARTITTASASSPQVVVQMNITGDNETLVKDVIAMLQSLVGTNAEPFLATQYFILRHPYLALLVAAATASLSSAVGVCAAILFLKSRS